MKKLLLTLLLLVSLASFAQTPVVNFYAPAMNIYDPPYGLVAQLWNPSETITVDEVKVSGTPDGTLTGAVTFAVGLSNIEQPGCQATSITAADGVSTTSVRVSQQPCVINGQSYSTANYTPTNISVLAQCWGNICVFDRPFVLVPGRGITVYVARFLSPTNYANGFPGYIGVNFYWHK